MNAVNVTPVAQATSFANPELAACHEVIADAIGGLNKATKRVGEVSKGLAVARNNSYDNAWFGAPGVDKGQTKLIPAKKQTTAFEVEHKSLTQMLEKLEYSNVSQFMSRLRMQGFVDACERGLTLGGVKHSMQMLNEYNAAVLAEASAKKAEAEARKANGGSKPTEYERTQKELTAMFKRLHAADDSIPEKLKQVRATIGEVLEQDFGLDLASIC